MPLQQSSFFSTCAIFLDSNYKFSCIYREIVVKLNKNRKRKMMLENQNTEYKENWRDECLKWVCGFANAQGGTIYIGVNDNGKVVGLKNVRKLMEDIPNKIQSYLGIIADVNKLTDNGLDYIEIKVESSSFPISYHGEFHYRCGNTKQQLKGVALSEFIMRKTGSHWEDVAVEKIKIDDLDDESFKIFRRETLQRKRMAKEELDIPKIDLLNKLHLMTDNKLKRSAVLLFYHDPAVIQNGIHIQIGKFNDKADILYQDILEGSLISTADKIVDLIYLKYLKAKITFEHDRRVETYPFAREAVREAVFNAMIHNCYMFGTPIQIRIEEKEMIISNSCILPDGWTIDSLMNKHNSNPYNPDIANVFYRAGYIEHWGLGIQKIFNACKELGSEPPMYELEGNTLRLHLKALQTALIDCEKIDGGLDGGLDDKILEILSKKPNITLNELAKLVKTPLRTIQRRIHKLKKIKKVKRAGGRVRGHWEVK